MSKTLAQISQAGTSIWLDDLSRERMIDNGKSRSLKSLIAEESVVGVTTNPAIFSSSISQSSLYSDDLKALAAKGYPAEQIITELTCSDVAKACDLFREVFLASSGVDGRVSIEVDPRFAIDTKKTISQARELWKKIDRPNLHIKVPATIEGLPAIQTLISEGISVNVTIIFSTKRYEQVLDAFIKGLEDRARKSLPLSNIHSVASFFISRVDTEIDPRLKASALKEALDLLGKSA
ncbi:MAG: transaldolase, partial [Actinomycetota bacterium]